MKILATIVLIVLLVAPARAAYDLGANGYAYNSFSVMTAEPLTMSCKARVVTILNSRTGLSFVKYTGVGYFTVLARSTQIRTIKRDTASTTGDAASSAAPSNNTWFTMTGVFAGTASRSSFLNGAAKGSETTATAGATPDTLILGARVQNSTVSDYITGALAECGIWDVALTDAEVAQLDKFSPLCVRRANLVAYWPLLRDPPGAPTLFFNKMSRGMALVEQGTAETVVDHPPVSRCQ